MITVEIEVGKQGGGWEHRDTAHCEHGPQVILAARALWDEAYTGIQGCRRRITFIGASGEVVARLEYRP